jgi:ribosome-associated translation inhibitor RaiA
MQIAFEHVAHSDAVEARVWAEAQKLEQFYERITSARIVIGKPQNRQQKGNTYSVRIHLTLPGGADIHVTRDPGEDGRHEEVSVTIRDAFDAAKRQLQDVVRRRQDAVKGG